VIRQYVDWIVRFPKVVVAIVLTVSVILAAGLPRLHVELDIDKQIPQGHPLVEVGKRLERSFGGKYLTIVGFYPQKGTVYSPEILAKVKRINDAVSELPGVNPASVMSLMSTNLKDVRISEKSVQLVPFAGEVPKTPEELAKFQARVKQASTITSLLVNDDGTATTVMIDFTDFKAAGGGKDFYPRLESILERERDDTIRIETAGSPAVLYFMGRYTMRIAALFLLTLAMIGYLHYRAFRTLQGMFIPLVTALLGVVWSLGLVAWLRIPMDPWNMMTPILLLAVGAGHSVQILKRYYEEFGRLSAELPNESPKELNRLAVVEATTKMGSVMLAAGSIAALSFLSLLTMKIPSMQNFGLCTSFGIFAALIVELTFIPAVRILLPAPDAQHTAAQDKPEFFDPWIEKIADLVRHGREGKLFYASLAVLAVTLAGIGQLETRNSLSAQFFDVPSDTPVLGSLLHGPMEAFRLADEKTVGTRVVQILVEGDKPDALKEPKALKGMEELSLYAATLPSVGKVVSLVDMVKGIDYRVANQPRRKPTIPDRRETIDRYFKLYSMAGDTRGLSRLVDPDFKAAVITIYLKSDDHLRIREIVTRLEERSKTAFAATEVRASIGGGVTNAVALNETIVRGKINNLLQISALVFLITSLALRSVVGGFLVLLPLATSALVNLGVMGWSGVPLTMGTAAISAMAVGIGADYAIYFVFRVREQLQQVSDLREAVAAALLTSGKAISYVATAVAGGYLCLVLSFSKVHVELGVLVALTMLVCSFATIVLLPAILIRLKPRFLTR
jgi:predicted RND superfamily exporter protein